MTEAIRLGSVPHRRRSITAAAFMAAVILLAALAGMWLVASRRRTPSFTARVIRASWIRVPAPRSGAAVGNQYVVKLRLTRRPGVPASALWPEPRLRTQDGRKVGAQFFTQPVPDAPEGPSMDCYALHIDGKPPALPGSVIFVHLEERQWSPWWRPFDRGPEVTMPYPVDGGQILVPEPPPERRRPPLDALLNRN
jgi:hypothetical protein